MNYDYDVDLHGTWSRGATQANEASWLIRRFKGPEDGSPQFYRLSDRDEKLLKRPFTTVTMTLNKGNESDWAYTRQTGRFHVQLVVKAPTPAKALEVAEKKVRDYINAVTCEPPTLTFL
jgi:hypothetical protein